MKFNKRFRLRVSRKILDEFSDEYKSKHGYWFFGRLVDDLCKEYEFEKTSLRWNVAFFRPKNEQKYMLFVLKYSKYIMDKQKYYYY